MTLRFRFPPLRRIVDRGPLDHPELRRMTPDELADLPLPRWAAEAPQAAACVTRGS